MAASTSRLSAAPPPLPSTAPPNKQLAVLQGELDVLVCKLNGYEHALKDCEMQLAERDLQVALLKACISASGSQQQVQHPHEERQAESTPHTSTRLLPYAPPPQPEATAAAASLQVSLLRAALAEANYRLAAAGLLPVTATPAALHETQDTSITSPASLPSSATPGGNSTVCRRFRSKYSITEPASATTCSSTTTTCTTSSSSSHVICAEHPVIGSTCSKPEASSSSPCAPALCLLATRKPSAGAASPADWPDTPIGLGSNKLHPTAGSRPGPLAAPAAAAALAAVNQLESEFELAAAAGGAEPDVAEQAGLSDCAEQDAALRSSYGSSLSQERLPACSTGNRRAASSSSSPAGGARAICTPACSPCSSVSCDSLLGVRRSYGSARQCGLPAGLHSFPGVLSSCDNPLFAAAEDEAA